MRYYNKKQFAELAGKSTRELAVYIQRRKVIIVDDKIDVLDTTNAAFLNKNGVSLPDVDKSESAITSTHTSYPDDDEITDYAVSDKKYRHYMAQVKEKEDRLKALQISKLQGEVIPSELIKPLFQQYSQSVLTEVKNMYEEQLRYISKKYSIGLNEVAEIKGKLNDGLNEAIDRARKQTAKSIVNIVENFKEK
jgi:hypothetical protein